MYNKKIRKQMEALARKAKAWGEIWTVSMMDYDEENNEIVVYVGRMDVYKAWFDADTLQCKGTKC